ncbi:hypothetical protein ABQF34_07565 [Mycolicibacterium boenickei]
MPDVPLAVWVAKQVVQRVVEGSSINDPDHLFNASLEAPVGRSIDLREDDKLDEGTFKALIQEAVKVNRSK